MRVIMFQPRFCPLVESGLKRQTIRRRGDRRPPVPGELLSLREWTGKAYRSKQRVLREAPCKGVCPIRIDTGERIGRPLDVELSGIYLNPKELDHLARDDGFEDLDDMGRWWRAVHTMPFEGILIHWRPS